MRSLFCSRKSPIPTLGRPIWLFWWLIAMTFATAAGTGLAHMMVDPAFKARVTRHGEIRALVVQPDGKIVVAGDFTEVDAVPRNGLARLNPDGRLDAAFEPPADLSGTITALHVQTNGIILAGGSFPSDRTSPLGNPEFDAFRRFRPNGSLDTNFFPIHRGAAYPSVLALLPDSAGRYIALENYDEFVNGIRSVGFYASRFQEADGRVTQLAMLDDRLTAGCPLKDGGLIVAGEFWGGWKPFGQRFDRDRIAKLSANGDVDLGFAPVFTGASVPRITGVAETATGRIFVGGDFSTVDGKARPGIVRLLANGAVDTAFDPTKGPGFVAGVQDGIGAGVLVAGIWPQPDGKVLVAGYFQALQSYRLVRLLASGGVDSTWVMPRAYGFTYNSVAAVAGGFVVGGRLTFNGGGGVAVLKTTGTGAVDSSFAARVERPGGIESIGPQRDGKLLLGGSFTSINGTPRANLGRINRDGSLDTTFADAKITGRVSRVLAGPDGKVWIAGEFPTAGLGTRRGLARFNTNGTLDTSFFAKMELGTRAEDIALTSEGKLVACGILYHVSAPTAFVSRFNPDGSVDTAFKAADTGWLNFVPPDVATLAVLPDDRLMIGGTFGRVGTLVRTNLARLLPNGQADPSFNAGMFRDRWLAVTRVKQVRVDSQSRVFITGSFSELQSTPRESFACLGTNGALLPDFDLDFDPTVRGALAVNSKGVSVVGASYREGVLMFHPSGERRFNGDSIAAGGVSALALTEADEVIVAGNFAQIHSRSQVGIARLIAEPVAPTILTAPMSSVLNVGEPLSLQVVAQGLEPLTYVWRRDGTILEGHTTHQLRLAAATRVDAGIYRVEVTDALLREASSEARVLVVPPVEATLAPGPESGTYLIEGIPGDAEPMSAEEFAEFVSESSANLRDWSVWSSAWDWSWPGTARARPLVRADNDATFFRIRRK